MYHGCSGTVTARTSTSPRTRPLSLGASSVIDGAATRDEAVRLLRVCPALSSTTALYLIRVPGL